MDVDRGGAPVGSGRTLSAEQEREVQRLIRDRTPDQLKMVYALWTRQAVAELIRERYGIKLAVRTMGLYLERWGFTPQKPMKKAYERSPAAVKKWLDEEYPVIAACAKVEGAEIHWGDETGLRSDDVRGRSYAPQGQTPVVRVNNKRHGLSVISTVTNKGQMRWKAFDGALNSDILIDLLRRLVKDAGRKIYLILDNLRVHHSRPVKAWLAEHKREIEVFYLPGYSPELNPNEMANADLKQAVTKLAPARTKLQLAKATARHLSSVQRQPERIKSYFQDWLPCDPSSLVRWRRRIGEEGCEWLFEPSIKAAQSSGMLKRQSLSTDIVDTTVQPKAIAHPTDSRLLNRAREQLVVAAQDAGIELHQSYARVGKDVEAKAGRYAHAKQCQRMRREIRRLRTWLGRVIRDVQRKAGQISGVLKTRLQNAQRLHAQQRDSKNKLYALYAPEVECIAKGKARTPYEFGVKTSVAVTAKEGVVVGMQSMPGAP